MKKVNFRILLVTSLTLASLFSTQSITFASSDKTPKAVVPPTNEDVTTSFSSTMKKNAATMAQYSLNDRTYPLGAGMYFAGNVKSGGIWDYKRAYGTTVTYVFDKIYTTGEDLGNMHYGFVGRAGGFSSTLLKSAAGAYQIYSGTYHVNWYKTYFDDPKDQAAISRGISYWDNQSLRSSSILRMIDIELTEEEKEAINDTENILMQLN